MTDRVPRADAPAATRGGRAEGRDRSEDDSAGCFLCGRPFRASYAEPVDAGGGIELCVGCGVLYGLPTCC